VAKRGRRSVLDDFKKREILAIVFVGCSRRTAARYVGCAVSTIANTAVRDPEFAGQLRKAEQQAEIGYVKSIQKAAQKEQYWRAAAWALERRNPEDFAPKNPQVITVQQVTRLMVQFAQIISEEISDTNVAQAVLKRLNDLTAGLCRAHGRRAVETEE
jgi:hypothetical protein